MPEFLQDILIVFGRIITIIPLLLLMTLFMGKRAIAELPVFDFLVVIILGALVGADIADPNIQHVPTAFAIVAIAVFQRIVASWKLRNRKLGRLLTFEPTVVIQNGKFIDKNLKKIRYSIDNILRMLREKSVFDLNEVETAIVEANGTLSVFKRHDKHFVTREDLSMTKPAATISFPVIVEGTVYPDVLQSIKLNEAWLTEELSKLGIEDVNDVFFASVNKQLELHISLKNETRSGIPVMKH